MFHSSHIEISKSALTHNIDYLKSRFGDDTKMSSVIKGNAYGHGIEQIIPLAEESGIDHFSVFSADEAYRAFKVKHNETELMIMGMIEDEAIAWAIEHGVSFYVFDIFRLQSAKQYADEIGKPAHIHLELETGMHRTGISQEKLPDVLTFLLEHRHNFVIEGICTHFAGAESISNYLRIKNQLSLFVRTVKKLQKAGLTYKKLHTACSAAAIRYPRTIMDMVRIGIAQYGMWPNRETFMHDVMEQNGDEYATDPLRRVISWKSKVMSIKDVAANRFVGYGTSFLTQRKTKIATVPVGYVHGFSRSLSNSGSVLINGLKAPVIGVVNMNMLMADVTDLEGEVAKGDEVIIIGTDGTIDMSVSSFSELTNNLNYETLARLPNDIPRKIVA